MDLPLHHFCSANKITCIYFLSQTKNSSNKVADKSKVYFLILLFLMENSQQLQGIILGMHIFSFYKKLSFWVSTSWVTAGPEFSR